MARVCLHVGGLQVNGSDGIEPVSGCNIRMSQPIIGSPGPNIDMFCGPVVSCNGDGWFLCLIDLLFLPG